MNVDSTESKSAGFITAHQSLKAHHQRWRKIKLGVDALDQLTGGGISSRGIVEIAGDPGSGKTQMCLHLALACQMQCETRKGVVYISTEHPFPSKRLVQMEQVMKRNLRITEDSMKFTDNIFVEHLNTAVALEECVNQRLPILLENNPISLLIIDSITAAYTEEQNFVDRAHSFRRVVNALHSLQDKFDFGVLCTNRVRSVVDSSTLDDERIVPAMGLAWGSLVHTRFQLSRTPGSGERRCQLLFSPMAAPGHCSFAITEAGISDFA
ncbi:DNA repair protein XRCC3-like [Aedes aegypti]|uniref:RecA family profile 1 domain-containing protein n=1 Tax=Aedes aegypti TaxID=7159 RepID=A0A6I8U7Y5_AEDAE|nr:DNA repair protein XRCC3-like [Aedes aegypti]